MVPWFIRKWQTEVSIPFIQPHPVYHPLHPIPTNPAMFPHPVPSVHSNGLLHQQPNPRTLISPQDKLGLLPDALLQSRMHNSSCQTDKKRKIHLLRSYLPDWIVVALMLIVFSLLNHVQGYHREFDINDPTIQFSYATHERVPVPFLVVLAILFPTILIVLFSQLLLRSSWDTHTGLLGLALSLSLALAITNVTKVTVGRPRPDMLARCQPMIGASNAGVPSFGLSNSSICTTNASDPTLQDGFRSFPSGHSSSAWAGLGYLSLYLAGKFHLFDCRGHVLKIWISIAPLFGAALIAISRTMDYRHHWQDVLVGSALGALTAWFGYRFYYPTISSPSSHLPYSPRVPSEISLREGVNDANGSIHSGDSLTGDTENQINLTTRQATVNLPVPPHIGTHHHIASHHHHHISSPKSLPSYLPLGNPPLPRQDQHQHIASEKGLESQ